MKVLYNQQHYQNSVVTNKYMFHVCLDILFCDIITKKNKLRFS